jgi:hypothetical protein
MFERSQRVTRLRIWTTERQRNHYDQGGNSLKFTPEKVFGEFGIQNYKKLPEMSSKSELQCFGSET